MSQHYFVHINNSYVRIDLNEVFYIEAYAHHSKFFTSTEDLMPHISLKKLEQELPAELICRINRSVIVFISKIDRFDRETVYLKNGMSFSFGEGYKEAFFEKVIVMIHKEPEKGDI